VRREGQAVAEEDPLHGDDRDHDETLHQSGEDILAAHHSGVKEREARRRHQEHQRRRGEYPGGIASADLGIIDREGGCGAEYQHSERESEGSNQHTQSHQGHPLSSIRRHAAPNGVGSTSGYLGERIGGLLVTEVGTADKSGLVGKRSSGLIWRFDSQFRDSPPGLICCRIISNRLHASCSRRFGRVFASLRAVGDMQPYGAGAHPATRGCRRSRVRRGA
jgi:hypothetical protein